MKISNPYTTGNPVYDQNKFIGRADVVGNVLQTLHHPDTNAIALFGQRRIGKTSVLLRIKQELSANNEYTPIYFDLQHKAAFPLENVLYQIAQKISFVLKTPLPDRNRFDLNGRFFREIFIPAAVKSIKNQGLVLLFDECGALDSPQHRQAGRSFFPYLQNWLKTGAGVQAVFALGRRPGKLSANTLLTFKIIRSRKILLMAKRDCEAIIRQSEKNQSLRWSREAMNRVWYWTKGHPYFTQLLCSEIWESAHVKQTSQTIRTLEDVDAAIEGTLEQGAHVFHWIWNDLPLAEQIVLAAMAETRKDAFTQKEFTEVLNHSEVRSIVKEIKFRPTVLIWWELLCPANGGFRFAVPLFRRWLANEKPLRRVKAKLELNLERLAEALERSGKNYQKGNKNKAAWLLRNALHLHPSFFRSSRR